LVSLRSAASQASVDQPYTGASRSYAAPRCVCFGSPRRARLIVAQNATRGPQCWYMLVLIMIVPMVAMAVALERYIRPDMLIGALKG
jgi:hypothetical protein